MEDPTGTLLTDIEDLQSKTDKTNEDVKNLADKYSVTEQQIADLVLALNRGDLKGEKGEKGDKGDSIKGDPGEVGNSGKDGKDGLNGKDGKDGLNGLDGKDGNIKDLSPQEIRDSLELLSGDERLDAKVIKNLPEGKNYDEEIKTLQNRTQLLNQIATTRSGGSGTPATTVVSETTAGQSPIVGTSLNYAREDHSHGTPTSGAGATTFTALTDTPASYTGQTLKSVRVNAGETALEFFTVAGGGDALKADPLSQFAQTTSLQLKNTISDETGSGALVFATSPALLTPTADSLSITGTAGAGFINIQGQSVEPATPAAGIGQLHGNTQNGFTRLEIDNEGTTHTVVCQDNVFLGKNTSGGAITKGQVVYVTGSVGKIPTLSLAKADSVITTGATIGIALEPSVANNSFGQFMIGGIVDSVDTSAFTAGNVVYVSSTVAGDLTATRPVSPNFAKGIGVILNSGVGNGSILVNTAPFLGGVESGTNTNFAAVGTVTGSNLSGTNTGDNATNSQYSGLATSKENAITGTTSADFWSGAKTFINFATTVRGTVLTGLSLATSQVIAATDSVLLALGYLQAQITALTTVVSGKKTDSMSTNKLLGRATAATGVIEEITLGTNLSFTGTTLNAAGGSGTPATTVVSETTAGQSPAVGTSTNYAREDHTHGTPAGGAGATVGQATIDFGATEDGIASVTVATASALTASKIQVTPAGVATADHDPDDYMVEGITVGVANIVNATSFDILANAPNGTWGRYTINYAIF